MVKPVRRACLALVCLCGASCGAIAQALTDPTRPPAVMMSRAEGNAVTGSATAMRTATLQSVLISPARRVAVISGVSVALHEYFGDAVLVAIGESEVTLRSGKTETILKLYPDVLKLTGSPVTATPTTLQARHPS